MRIRLPSFGPAKQLIHLLLISSLFAPSLSARSPLWKPERIPGSAQLSWGSLETIIVPRNVVEPLEPALEDLIWVAAQRGVELEKRDEGGVPPKNSLRLRLKGAPADLNDGFVLKRERTRVELTAASVSGLRNGIYTLAQDALGARWYWPGDLGFELVGPPPDKLPDRIRRILPGFVQRTLHPMGTDFGRRNRLNRKYSFNHNLARIFTREVFEQSPDAFALIDGRRRAPGKSPKYDPQPNFTAEAAIALSVAASEQHFDKNPGANSFSLSINDNSRFDEGAATEAVVSPITYFRGLPNYTDLVFGYMNAVAEQVFDQPQYLENDRGEPRYLTALAYYWTEQSPSFAIHPRVMPVLTSDRAQWHDPEYRKEDRALIERWTDSGAERVATWDYYFGSPYPYPRQFTRWIGESIPYLHQEGVDVFFSQLPSVWGLDGPKAWLAAQLLWDPKLDTERLIDEFYANFFGPAAASLRAFYETAEARREAHEGAAKWIKFYKDEAGIELFDAATLGRMRTHLDEAAMAVREDARRTERVAVVDQAFRFTEAYHALQAARRALVEASIEGRRPGEDEANAGLVARWTEWEAARDRFGSVRRSVLEAPLQEGFSGFNRIFQSDPSAIAVQALAQADALEFVKLTGTDSELAAVAHGLQEGTYTRVARLANPKLRHSGSELRDFLGPELPVIDNWRIRYRASERLRVEPAQGPPDAQGLRVSGADIVTLEQAFQVAADNPYLLEIEAAWSISPDNRTWVGLVWDDASGKKLKTEVPLRLPSTEGQEASRGRLVFPLIAPPNARELKVGVITNRQAPGDFLELRRVSAYELVSRSVAADTSGSP